MPVTDSIRLAVHEYQNLVTESNAMRAKANLLETSLKTMEAAIAGRDKHNQDLLNMVHRINAELEEQRNRICPSCGHGMGRGLAPVTAAPSGIIKIIDMGD